MAARRRRRHDPDAEEHEAGAERWLVTYADMVTLLMVLFIVMFSMSQVDVEKFNALKEGLAEGFGSRSPLDGSTAVSQAKEGAVTPIEPRLVAAELRTRQTVEDPDPDQRRRAVEAETTRLERLRKQLDAALRREGLRNDVQLSYDERGLVISLISRHVTFRNDVATLSPRGARVVDTVSPVLRAVDDPLEIDGHTNQVDVKPAFFATDWDLSAARAVTVLRRLNERGHIPSPRLAVSAYGKERPLLPPDQPGSQQVNKRVDIVVVSPVPEAAKELADHYGRGTDVGAPPSGGA
ncbi:MAG TPA: flagellar motor protein MotB [Nocardioides sp.]|nr:flagellar motor protein MotB [Nocardioides sp.]